MNRDLVFQGTETVLNLSLVILGLYFIYQGDVMNRFMLKRTNFAEYYEDITELPTIFTWIEFDGYSESYLNVGIDFNVTWQWEWGDEDGYNPDIILKLGKNIIGIRKLEINFEAMGNRNETRNTIQNYKIIPLKYTPSTKPMNFWLTYEFTGREEPLVARVGVAISTQNNSYCGHDVNLYDGEIIDIVARKGEEKWITMRPVKYLYTQIHETCRDKPYHDLLLEKTIQVAREKCPFPCRPQEYWMCNSEFDTVPVCLTKQERECFSEVNKAAMKDIIAKPCTKVEYGVNIVDQPHRPESQDVTFWMGFTTPAKQKVKEEYLIYDLVAMISSIGGTMGLCIGVSFKDLTRWIIGYIKMC